MSSPPAPFALTAHLALLSSISFGGFPTVLPALYERFSGKEMPLRGADEQDTSAPDFGRVKTS